MDILNTVLDILDKAGVVGLAIFIMIGGAKKLWVWGWAYIDMEKDRDEWKELALGGVTAARVAVNLAERRSEHSA